MHLYSWRGCNKKGRIFTGKRWGENPQAVAEFVRNKHGYVLRITRDGHRTGRFHPLSSHLTDKQKGLFFSRLSSLLASGIPLLRSLELIEEKASQNLQRVCSLLQADLEKGLSFAAALGKQPREFNYLAMQVTEAGETSGELTMLLGELSAYYLKERETKRFLFNACLYPAVVLILTFCTLGYFAFEVLPMFGHVYLALGIQPGRLLMFIIHMVGAVKTAPGFLGTLGVLFLASVLLCRRKIPGVFLRMPLIRNYHKAFLEIRCCRLLGLLLTSGITLPQALRLVEGTLSQPGMSLSIRQIRENLLRGHSLEEAVTTRKGIFGRVSREFIAIGEQGGNLDTMLAEAANILDGDLAAGLKDCKVLLEPAMLLILAVIVGGGFSFLLAPVYEILDKFTEI